MIGRVRCVLRSHAQVKLSGRGKYRAFCEYDPLQRMFGKIKYAGLTKCLQRKLYPKKQLPIGKACARLAGFRRGIFIDKQLSKIANSQTRKVKRPNTLHRISKLVLAALATDGIELVCAQTPVSLPSHKVASAVDFIGIRRCDDDPSAYELILIELKTGYDQDRTAASTNNHMQHPFTLIEDTWCNRHLAQLACTWRMFVKNTPMINELYGQCAIRDISGMLLYATERDIEAVPLPKYWAHIATPILASVRK